MANEAELDNYTKTLEELGVKVTEVTHEDGVIKATIILPTASIDTLSCFTAKEMWLTKAPVSIPEFTQVTLPKLNFVYPSIDIEALLKQFDKQVSEMVFGPVASAPCPSCKKSFWACQCLDLSDLEKEMEREQTPTLAEIEAERFNKRIGVHEPSKKVQPKQEDTNEPVKYTNVGVRDARCYFCHDRQATRRITSTDQPICDRCAEAL